MSVRDASGSALASDGDGGQGLVLWKAPISQTYFVQLSSNFGSDGGGYGWLIEATTLTDDHGDLPASASQITLSGGTANGTANIDFFGDDDLLKFSATAGRVYRITCTPMTTTDCYVAVRDAGSFDLAKDTGGGSAELFWSAPSTGTFFVRLAAFNSNPAFTRDVGQYSWQIEETAITDDHGDQVSSATLVTFTAGSASGSGSIEISGDKDVLKFNAVSGRIYRLTATPTGLSNFTIGFIRADGTNGNGWSDFSSNGGYSVGWAAPTTDVYGISFSAGGTSTGTYTWTLEELASDDHPNVAAPGASVLTLGVAAAGLLEAAGDEDYFAIDLTAGQTITVDTPGTAAGTVTASILNPLGSQFATWFTATTFPKSSNSSGVFPKTAEFTGTYYVRIRHAQYPNGTGAYQLQITSP